MSTLFNEDYFERGIELGISGYTNYRWLPDLTIPMCYRMIQYLGIKEKDLILDFGCAKGYLVKAFRLLHFKAWGYETSKYAIENAPNDVKSYIYWAGSAYILPDHFDWIIAKDVFEHISYETIDSILKSLRQKCKKMFAIIPLANGEEYNVPIYENDKTHIIRESLEWWANEFMEAGFNVLEKTYRVKHIKENYAQYEKGNGFFILS
jgi:SAM-dependent methyltransferase